MWEDKCYELLKATCMRHSTEILEYTEKYEKNSETRAVVWVAKGQGIDCISVISYDLQHFSLCFLKFINFWHSDNAVRFMYRILGVEKVTIIKLTVLSNGYFTVKLCLLFNTLH